MRTRHTLKGLALASGLLLLSGCQTLSSKQSLDDFNQQYGQGNYQAAADFALTSGGINAEGEGGNLLWSLQAGSALKASGQFAYSTKVFDHAETMMKAEDTENIGRKGLEKVTATLINNNLNRYDPTVYDGVMVNTYKALNSIFLQDLQGARIEFNRAADRQRRAEETFKTRIEEQKAKLAETREQTEGEQAANSQLDFGKSEQASRQAIDEAFAELDDWKAYPDFVNPYTDYLHGLYFMLASADRADYGKARESMRRVRGMVSDNDAVKTDYMVINKLRTGAWRKHKLNPAVWVIFENGEAPTIDEILVPLPLFLISDKVEYAQIALPKLKERARAYPYLEIRSGGKRLGKTELLASMDRVIQTEFKREFPLKVTEAIASTLTKAFIQYQAKKELGLAGSLVAGIYQAATTRADTRSWSSLPKEVQVSRVRKPANGTLELHAPGLSEPLKVELPKTRFSVIYVKASAPGSTPVYQVAGFDA
ncbi:hypothetical protein CLV44_11134 [Marinobacterium halophilum]|uniref:Lipoprotein n=1 Tax=Marinobacterium halophilum TaxID=267374 RepID=A0A2P8EVY2_9GAMM|nr:hypothetical protein [Marinobacterium halophilum]PSL13626.1 hypothetical protein CLV44_11134 [Marinobacterium halophilum]